MKHLLLLSIADEAPPRSNNSPSPYLLPSCSLISLCILSCTSGYFMRKMTAHSMKVAEVSVPAKKRSQSAPRRLSMPRREEKTLPESPLRCCCISRWRSTKDPCGRSEFKMPVKVKGVAAASTVIVAATVAAAILSSNL